MSLCFYQTDSEEDTLTDDDEDEVKKHSNDQDPGVSADYVTQQDVTLSTIPADNTTLFEIEDVQPTDTGFSWLQKNLVVQYWCGHGYSEEISGGHDSCNLTSDWLVFLCNMTSDWLVFLCNLTSDWLVFLCNLTSDWMVFLCNLTSNWLVF